MIDTKNAIRISGTGSLSAYFIRNTDGTDTTLTVASGATLNTEYIVEKTGSATQYTIYGSYAVEDYYGLRVYAGGKITLTPGSTLTLSDEGFLEFYQGAKLADLTVGAGAKIVNNTYITFPQGTTAEQIAALPVSGPGEIRIATEYNSSGYPTAYDVLLYYVSANTSKGSVTPAFEQVAAQTGTAVGATAKPVSGCRFVSWTDKNGNVVSTDATFAPGKPAGGYVGGTYTANFYGTPTSNVSVGGSTATTTTTTTTNPDGSTTTTVTNKTTGTVTETTKAKDGGTTVVETKKDGTVTTAATDKTGNTVQTVKKSDGSMTSSETRADGTKITSATTAAGKTTAAVTASGKTEIAFPAALGKTDGKVSAKVSYPNGAKETVTASYSGGRVSLSVDGSAAVEILDDFVPLASAMPFTDVPESAYYHDAVLWAVGKNVAAGTTPATFSPGANCTRAQVVTFLWRAMGSPEPTGTKNPFADVSADAYYYKAVLWAAEEGVAAGAPNANFYPNAAATRAEFVTLLWRAAGSPEPTGTSRFTDAADPAAWYYKAVLWAAEQGVAAGTAPAAFSPDAVCTRGQVAVFLYRYFGK